MESSLRIGLIDDHGLRAAGLASVLSEKCFHTGDDIALVRTSDIMGDRFAGRSQVPDVCLYNVGGTPIDDPHVLMVVRHCLAALGGQPLILLSDQLDASSIQTAIELGVQGVVPTEMNVEIAVAAIRFILAGGHYYPHAVPPLRRTALPEHPVGRSAIRAPDPGIRPMPRDLPRPGADAACLTDIQGTADPNVAFNFKDRKVHLTRRQYDVLTALEKGLTNKAIGRELDLSEATVKVHLRHLMRKFGATNRTQIALLVLSARNAAVPSGQDAGIPIILDEFSADHHVTL